jgi:hypothetical protein
MRNLNNYITEKLKIRKSSENTIETIYIGIYNTEVLMDALDSMYGRGKHNIFLYDNVADDDVNYCSLKYKTDDDLIKLFSFIELVFDACMYNGEENNSEDIGHYIQDKSIVKYVGEEYQSEIEECIKTYEENFYKVYKEIIRPYKNVHRGKKLVSVNNNMKYKR